ncbi:MAG: hypothetical protein JNL05_04020 [Flavobacteriales bacterium]|nr:hypothetical protein [Flavobacteriales bacterium]
MELQANNERLERILLGQELLLEEVHDILEREQKRDDILRAVVLSSKGHRVNIIDRIDPERVFHVDSIRDLCVKYRLRFLDAGRFRGDLPPQAIHHLRRLEDRASAPLRGFRIMAPADRFRLCDADADPLLFVPVGPSHYYLVHRWGRDMSPVRAVMAWPFRSPATLGACVFALAFLAAMLAPNIIITTDPDAGWWGGHRLLFLFWSAMVLASFTVFSWFAFHGRFSRDCWNSNTFN